MTVGAINLSGFVSGVTTDKARARCMGKESVRYFSSWNVKYGRTRLLQYNGCSVVDVLRGKAALRGTVVRCPDYSN